MPVEQASLPDHFTTHPGKWQAQPLANQKISCYHNAMNKLVTALKEHKEFTKNNPWSVIISTFPNNEIVPAHYAETIEILLFCEVEGEIHIGTNRLELHGHQAVYIAPNVVHSIHYKKNNGRLSNMKLELKGLKEYIDIENIVHSSGCSLSDLNYLVSDYEICCNLSAALSDDTVSLADKLLAILSFFKAQLAASAPGSRIPVKTSGDLQLHRIIDWTEANFSKKITVDEAAQILGYNKYYFCSKFKKATGITYLNYVNTVRISHACNLLKNGCTINEACDACGFENLSYFIQLFKKIMGTTPRKYCLQCRESSL